MMASIDFYYMPESPPCRIVEVVAAVAGVKLNKKHVNLFTGEHMQPDFLKLNPWHKVPFLVDGEVKINESRAISQYLVNKYLPADNTLYPQDPVKRARIDELLHFDIGTLYASSSKLLSYRIRNPAEGMNPENEAALRANLKLLDGMLAGKKYITGDHYTLADIAIATGLTFPDACDFDRSEYKNVDAWMETCKNEVPHFKEFNEKPTENMRGFLKAKLAEATGKA